MANASRLYSNRRTDFVPPEGYTTDAVAHRTAWIESARPKQITPPGDWQSWMNLAGRGYGKTRVGAEDFFWYAFMNPRARLVVVAPTHGDVRDTVFEGESGLLEVIPHSLIPKGGYVRTLSELTLVNGAFIKGFSATEPDRMRGPQFHRGWLDEFAAFDSNYQGCAQDVLDVLEFALRLGDDPRLIITTTPKPIEALKKLIANSDTHVTIGSTHENKANLPQKFFDKITKYEGTRLGNQEIYAEILDNEDVGYVKRDWFKIWPDGRKLPKFSYLLVSWDTALTEKTVEKKDKQRKHEPDPTACHVYGIFADMHNNAHAMLLDAWDLHLAFPELEERSEEMWKSSWGGGNKKRVDIMLIEEKGSGISLRQSLEKKKIPVHPYNPGRADKLLRLHLVTPAIKAGRIWLLESQDEKRKGKPRSWYEPVLSQVCSFIGEGSIRKDDHVDAMTQAVRFFLDHNIIRLETMTPQAEARAAEAVVVGEMTTEENPYAA